MGNIEIRPADPHPEALATLRHAIAQTGALGYTELSDNLKGLLERFSGEAGTQIRIDVAAGAVSIGGRPANLTNRELELCVALAVHRRPLPSETLADLLFPDQPVLVALNRLKVYVHRVREKVAANFISCGRNGYELRADVLVDLNEFAGMLDLLARRPLLNDDERAELQRVIEQTYGFRNTAASRWQWIGAVERRIAELASRAATQLASDAFARSATTEMLELARIILQSDPCDELGREIAIKAHLAAGRRREALAEFKRYELTVRSEMGCRPSAHLRELLETA